MTAISLEKGARVDLTKTNPGITAYGTGLGWDQKSATTGKDFDLDVSAMVLGANGKLISDLHFVFYNNVDGKGLKSIDKTTQTLVDSAFGVFHEGDNLTGQGDGDDETINIDFSKLPAEAEKIIFVVTIHEAKERGQNFGQVNNAFIRMYDKANPGTEVLRYDLGEDFSGETAVEFANLYKKDGEWKFNAVGTGMKGGLADYLALYK
jgi:tellurium resistance protein TerD